MGWREIYRFMLYFLGIFSVYTGEGIRMKVSKQTAKLFLQGDEAATAEVYHSYKSLLYFIISSYLRNKADCEDVYQDTFLTILTKRDSIKDPSALHSYLCLTAKSKAIDFAKSRAFSEEGLEEEEEASAPSESNIDSLLPYDLSHEEREIIGYRIVFGLTFQEASDITGAPLITLKTRYARALKKIKGAGK